MSSIYKIFIENYHANIEIGVFEHEYRRTQPIIIHVEIHAHEPERGENFSYGTVVCYDSVTILIDDILKKSPHIELIETLAATIADAIIALDLALFCKIHIIKPEALQGKATPSIEIQRYKE